MGIDKIFEFFMGFDMVEMFFVVNNFVCCFVCFIGIKKLIVFLNIFYKDFRVIGMEKMSIILKIGFFLK